MSETTGISWTDSTWNPTSGCTKVSPGCDNCYAEGIARRFSGTKAWPNGFDVTLRPEKLTLPLRWRKPRRIFVNSTSDLFHDRVPDEYIARVFAVMAAARRHTFQVLTKRHARMRSLLSGEAFRDAVAEAAHQYADPTRGGSIPTGPWTDGPEWWPLPNCWLGVSAENQQWADIRIPALLDTPAAVRFVSAEPLLAPIKLRPEWLEWTDGRPDEQGERGLPGGRDWGTVDRQSGQGLAPCAPTREPLGGRHCDDSVCPEAGGEPGREVPTGSGDVRRQANSCACPSSCVAAIQRPDPAGCDGQSQERSAFRQPAIEPGAVDKYRAGEACPHCASAGQSESVRTSKPSSEANDGTGPRDLFAPSRRRTPEGSRGRLRGCTTDDFEDRSGRSPLAWLIVGGESGRGARPMHPDWASSLRDQCQDAGVAFFMKQAGVVLAREWGLRGAGADPALWPERFPQEFPR